MKPVLILSATLLALTSTAALAHGYDTHNNADSRSESRADSRSESRATSGVSGSGDASITERNPVAGAFAAPLAVGDCLGSSSVGGSLPGFSLSLGSMWHNTECERRYNAAQMHNLGLNDVAIALMCDDDGVREKMEAMGHHCPERKPAKDDSRAQAYPSGGKAIDRE